MITEVSIFRCCIVVVIVVLLSSFIVSVGKYLTVLAEVLLVQLGQCDMHESVQIIYLLTCGRNLAVCNLFSLAHKICMMCM